MRPFRSFLLLLLVLCCLTGLYYVIPSGISLPGIFDFLPVLKPVINQVTVTPGVFTDRLEADSLVKTQSGEPDQNIADTGSRQGSFEEKIWHQFDSLYSSDRQIRIMYYGDSQIEGDRITSYLRESLRQKYGGTGPGLFLPLMPVMYTRSLFIESSGNWKRYNYLSFKNREYKSRSLGPFMTVCRFLPPGTRVKNGKAFVKIIPSGQADSSVASYDSLRIMYRNEEGRVNVTITAGSKIMLTDTLKTGRQVNELSCRLDRSDEVRIEFEGQVSPDIYGISLEGRRGLIVDNIPQRGSAGLEFSMVDSADLRASYRLLNPSLIILHYGLNIVKNVRKDYAFYEDGFYRQLERIKEICPATPVLVVGVTDMAYSEGDSVKSFPNIPLIIDAQKKAAGRAGEGFWDSREAMGGALSVVRWSKKIPPLARADLVHFTNSGADTLSGLLVKGVFSFNDTVHILAVAHHTVRDSITTKHETGAESFKKEVSINRGLAGDVIARIFTYDPRNSFIFTTPGFWIFLLVVFAGYSLLYRQLRLRNIYLLLISLYFYFKTGGLFLFLLVFVTVVDYTCGILISRAEKRPLRRFFLILSLFSNLGLLGYFKYAAFLTEGLNSVLGTDFRVFDLFSSVSNSWLGTTFDTSFIILPVGISFFTFQSLSYTIDVYRKRMDAVKNIIDFGFYVSFFPHLVAGPIVRASVFMPQVYQKFNLSKREFSHSLFMISRGLIKKIVISNFIAVTFVDRIFDAPALYSGFENLMAVYGYGLQIYCDFSGYTDIAIGIALILGFRLPVNFNSPYKASSITDFWKRWHISLSQWLKDYLYISLGGNRKGKIRTYLNLMVTMILGGLWHGADLRFIIWGALHGVGLVIDKIRSAIFSGRESFKTISRITGIIITFNFVNFCWIFFRAESMENAGIMLRQIFNSFSPGSYLTVLPAYGQVFLLIVVGYLVHFLPEKIKESYRGFFIRTPIAGQLVFILLLAIALWQMRSTEIMPFIYFRF